MAARRHSILGYPIAHNVGIVTSVLILAVVFTIQLRHADHVGHRGTLIDDAYISLRYSQNLIEGHGLVWQPGDRVEGYTNFLWVILSAFPMLMGLSGTDTVRFLGVLSSLVSIVILLRISRQFQKMSNLHSWPVGVAALLVGINFDFAFWTLSGLETPLFIMLSLAGFYYTLKAVHTPESLGYAVGSGLALAAATLTRPDGVVVAAALWTPWVVYRVTASKRLVSIFERPLLTSFALYTCIVLAHLIWRYSYYGQLLPNTFYVKVGSTTDQIQRGIVYILEMTKHIGLIPVAAFAPFAFLPLAKQQHPERSNIWTARFMVLSLALGYTAYIILVGGDVFATRFLTLVFVLVCLMIEISISNMMEIAKRHTSPIIQTLPLLALLLTLFAGANKLWDAHIIDTYIAQSSWIRTGAWLRAHAGPNDTLAIDAAGSIPYFSALRSIDMLGLNDAYIARMPVKAMGRGSPGHEKFDPAYVYAQSPTWIATWLDREGRALAMGMYRWPEVLDYRLAMVVQTQDLSLPWMQLVDPHHNPHSSFDQGYRYGLWKRIPDRPALAYTDLDLEDQTAVQQVGAWEWLIKPVSGNDYLSSIDPDAALKFEMDGGQAIAAVTLRHNTSGQIQIQAGGQAIVCDLYSSVTVPQAPCMLPPVGKPGERIQATVAVHNERNGAIQGGGVHIQRLLVLPPATYAYLEQ